MKTRSKESLHLSDVLKLLKPSEFKDNHLAAYKVRMSRTKMLVFQLQRLNNSK